MPAVPSRVFLRSFARVQSARRPQLIKEKTMALPERRPGLLCPFAKLLPFKVVVRRTILNEASIAD
jgi:hypothetical protein